MLAANPSAVQEEGSGLLNSLFGGGTVSGLAHSVGRFAGLGTGAVQKLLGSLTPLILGAIAGRFAGKKVSQQALTSLFAEEKYNIANAMPSGFSLRDVPGLATVEEPVRRETVRAARQVPHETALPKWLLPLLLIGALGLGAWLLSRTRTRAPDIVPNVAAVTTRISDSFRDLDDTFAGISDTASASKAVDKHQNHNTRLDDIKASVAELPTADRGRITDLVRNNFSRLENQFAKLLWIPGVADKIKPLASQALNKLASIGGLSSSQLPEISGDLAGAFTSLTDTLKGIRDPASADAALSKLRDISTNLDGVTNKMDTLSDTGRSTIRSMAQSALPKLRSLVDQVLGMAGISDSIKSIVNGIMDKLTALVA
jgi:hypothetical protein